MNNNDLSIATITLARDEKEADLLRTSLRQLAALQLPVHITDGGSEPAFLDYVRVVPQFILSDKEARGVWAQAKTSVLAAYETGSKFILYTEPDKLDFFKEYLPAMIETAQVEEKTGIILASRTLDGFATFPAFQRKTETTINQCCAEVIGKEVDYTYGPFLLNRELVPYLEHIKEEIGWGWRPFLFTLAHLSGYQVQTFEGPFSCPKDQRQDDEKERLYRMRQLVENIQGILLACHV